MSLVENIKSLCAETGISIPKLEVELGLSRGSIYNWDKNSPSTDKVTKVADYFNVSVDYLIGKTNFRKPMELFEYWGGQNDPYFEAPFDFGKLLRREREVQGVSQLDVSKALNLTESDVDDLEDGLLPLNYAWAEKYASFLGTSVQRIFSDNNMGDLLKNIPLELLHHYQEQGMSEEEMVKAYNEFREAEFKDARSDPGYGEYPKEKEEPETFAAHHDGEDWTEDELQDIEEFKEILKLKRQLKKNKE